MKIATFYFAATLLPLVKHILRGESIHINFNGPQSVKHLIESLGIPHTEIGQISVNGDITEQGYIVQHGDRIRIKPVAPNDLAEEPRFVIDGHLGRLASHIRMLGLDCQYDNAYEDKVLVDISVEQERFLLTRDRLLLMHKVISKGYLVRSLDTNEQLREVIIRFGLDKWIRPFQRCMRCNHLLELVEKDLILEKLEPLTKKYFHEFKLCPVCDQVYWKGSHYERMLEVIKKISKS